MEFASVLQRDVPNPSGQALTPAQAFDLAVSLHRQGRVGQAEQIYRGILQINPDHFGALQYLGIIATQHGKLDEGERLTRRALVLKPDAADARNNLGIGQVRRLLANCNLEWDERCLAFHETQRQVQTASAMQVRQPLYGTSVGRWQPYQHLLRPLLDDLGLREKAGPDDEQSGQRECIR